jgi:hypothetical protein
VAPRHPPVIAPRNLTAPRNLAVAVAGWCVLIGCDFFTFSEPALIPGEAGAGGSAGRANTDRGSGGETLAPPEPCEPQTNECGPSKSGKEQVCFKASALAGKDFCAEACDPTQPTADADHVCVDSGALLRRCHPNSYVPSGGAGELRLSDAEAAADCPPGLNCYRTSLTEDEGLCINMPVCASDDDCDGLNQDTCASSLLGGIVAAKLGVLKLDHLNCVTRYCVRYNTACGPGQGCLGEEYSTDIADICTPRCDGDQHCPPNYSCARRTSGPQAVNLCIPGVPGFRCVNQNCVAGACEASGAGFSVCTTSCDGDPNRCAALNTATDQFVCVEHDGEKHCVTPRPFHGANCTDDDGCDAGRNEFCSFYDRVSFDGRRGECRVPCEPDLTCEPQGGLPHVCLAAGKGGCFPGRLGLTCMSDSECISNSCVEVAADPDTELDREKVCTIECGRNGESADQADAQCDNPSNVNREGYCNEGYCRGKRSVGYPCTRDAHCLTALCNPDLNECELLDLPMP